MKAIVFSKHCFSKIENLSVGYEYEKTCGETGFVYNNDSKD